MSRSALERWRREGAGRLARTVLWFLGSLAILLTAFVVIGVEEVVGLLAEADTVVVAAVVVAAFFVLVARGVALWIVLHALGRPVSILRALGIYFATAFVSAVAPSGQAGGAPINGLVVARSADTEYEVGVAAVLSVGALANLMVVLYGLVGVAYLVAVTSVRRSVVVLAVVGIGVVVGSLFGIYTAWRYRESVVVATTSVLVSLSRAIGRVLPRVSPPEREAIERRVRRFGRTFYRLSHGTRGQLAAMVALMALAHGLSVVALWLSFVAFGYSISIGVVLAVIPAAVLAAVAPLPGGLGGVEVALVTLLTATTGVTAAVAGAAVVVYRAAAYWPRFLVGGVVAAALVSFSWFS